MFIKKLFLQTISYSTFVLPMRKIILLPFFAFAILTISAQSNRKLLIGGTFSPDYSFRILTTSDTSSYALMKNKNSQDRAFLGFTSGVVFQKKLLGIFGFETGLNYSRKGEQTSRDTINPMGGIAFGRLNEVSLYNFLCIPLKLRLHFTRSKSSLFVTAGVTTNYLLDAFVESAMTSKGQTSTFKTEINKNLYHVLLFNTMFSVGADFQLMKRCFLRVETNFSKSINSFRTDNLNSYLYSGGLNIGLLFGSKK